MCPATEVWGNVCPQHKLPVLTEVDVHRNLPTCHSRSLAKKLQKGEGSGGLDLSLVDLSCTHPWLCAPALGTV